MKQTCPSRVQSLDRKRYCLKTGAPSSCSSNLTVEDVIELSGLGPFLSVEGAGRHGRTPRRGQSRPPGSCRSCWSVHTAWASATLRLQWCGGKICNQRLVVNTVVHCALTPCRFTALCWRREEYKLTGYTGPGVRMVAGSASLTNYKRTACVDYIVREET